MVTDQLLYQRKILFRKLFPFSDGCLCLSADCSLEALSTCDWRQINLGMIVTSKSHSPSCSFKTLGIKTKVFFFLRRQKTSGWHHISLVSIVWPTVFSRVCLEQTVTAVCTFQLCLHQRPSIKAACVYSFYCKNLLWKYRILEKRPRGGFMLDSEQSGANTLVFLPFLVPPHAHVFTGALTAVLSLELHASTPSLTTK